MNSLIWLAAFNNYADNTPRQMALPWDRFAAMFSEHNQRSEKDGSLFSPTLYKKNAKRGNKGVQQVYALVLDLDKGIDPEHFKAAWDGYAHICYSSYSHTTTHPKWRAIFPFTQPVEAADWPRIYLNLVTALADGHIDTSCKDCSRMYYMPSCPIGTKHWSAVVEGTWLDPLTFPDVQPVQPVHVPRVHASNGNGKLDSTELITRALDRCHAEGRNQTGLWLACQLRDNQFDRSEAESALADYAARTPTSTHPYTFEEALSSLEQAYSAPAREPWEQPGRPIGFGNEPSPDSLVLIHAAIATLKTNPGAIAEPPIPQLLADVRRWDPAEWLRLQAQIRKAGIPLKELDRLVANTEPPEPPTETTDRPRYAGDMLESCPAPKMIVPAGYVLQEQRLAQVVETDSGDGNKGAALKTIANAPLLVGGRSENKLTGEEMVLVWWRFPGSGWRSRLLDRGTIANGRKLTDQASYGFPVADTNSKDLVRYFQRLEIANRLHLPCAQVTTHLGWQGNPLDDTSFLLGSTLILPSGESEAIGTLDAERPDEWRPDRVLFAGAEGEQQIVGAFQSAGTYPHWVDAARRLLEFPRITAMLHAAFCPPLLKLFNVPNFVVDLSHATTTGKTTALRLAGSAWGNPNDTSPETLLHTWDITRVFLERVSHICSGVPVILDDTKRARNAQIVAEVIYEVVSGRGRGRGTIKGLAHTATWRTVLLSTGEQPATSFTQDGGARTRVLSLRGLPFGDKSPTIGNLAKSVNRALCANYGHAAPRFLTWLMQERERWSEWQETYERWNEFYSAEPATPESGRLAQYAALVTVAGSMLHLALPELGEFTNPMQALWPEVSAEASDAAGGKRALRDVLSWSQSHSQAFIGRRQVDIFGRDRALPPETAGRWDNEEDWQFLAFFPSVLRKVLAELGYPHPDSIFEEWRSSGWLHHLPGKYYGKYRHKDSPSPVSMIKIRRTAVDRLDLEDETEGGTE